MQSGGDSKLLIKFNDSTNGEFDYIKLSAVNADVKKCEFEFVFIYPAEREGEVSAKRDYIVGALKNIIRTTAGVSIKLKKSHFDFTIFKANLSAFLNKFPALSSTITDKDIECATVDGNIEITLSLHESVYDYCISQKVSSEIADFISVNYCEKISVKLVSKGDTDITVKSRDGERSQFALERPEEGRSIRPQNVEDFIGRIIYDLAEYISDARPKEYAVLCGTVSRITELESKPKMNDKNELKPGKKYFRFSLEDYTGNIGCLYFPNKKTFDQFASLKEGKQIVARGRIDSDSRGSGRLTFIVNDISLCTLPKDFKVNKIYRKAAEEYSVVFPKPYVSKKQSSLFDVEVGASVPPFLIGKTFCVFDIETTGLDPYTCKIIEIGAVKLVDGVKTEVFSTFVDPKEPLTDKIKNLTGIQDADLKGQPLIEDVMPDFYKFTENCTLVAQNVPFDFSFISVNAKPMQFNFENPLLDTCELAKQHLKGLHNYKLDTIVKYYGIVNEGAHRAIYDAIATAEVFVKLAEKLY